MNLDALIEKKVTLITQTFVSEVRVYQLAPANKSNAEIAAQIELFLSAVVNFLRRGGKEQEALKLAAYHGEQRARLGYDLRSVLREFGVLRSTIVEVALPNVSISVAELERLAQVLEASMIEAATRFVAHANQTNIRTAARAALGRGSASR